MTRNVVLALLFSSVFIVSTHAETLRGPIAGRVPISGADSSTEVVFAMEEIVVIELADNHRFIDAIEIALTSPNAVSTVAGAVSVVLLSAATVSGTNGVVDVVGEQLLSIPLQRQGTSRYQILLHNDAEPDGSVAMVRAPRVVDRTSLPLVLSVVTRMKGLASELYNSEFSLSVVPVPRDIGALQVNYRLEDGSTVELGPRNPGFAMRINGDPVTVLSEYLLPPGLHRISLESDRYVDQEFTIGVERGRETALVLPLRISLARVTYTAPREAILYLNGELLPATSGDFTVEPGEHTITMVLDDYTVTRRFTVEEQRAYTLSLAMNIVIEEVN